MVENASGLKNPEVKSGIFGFTRPFVEKIGERVMSIGGIGLSISGLFYCADSLIKESLGNFALASGLTLLGLWVVNGAGMWRKSI